MAPKQLTYVVLGTSGDNAILILDDANTMHRFAEAVHQATVIHNRSKTVDFAKRWFRMGAATGIVEFDPSKRRIIGITTARAVRLEAASGKGQLVVDLATFDALQDDLRRVYDAEEIIQGKREERYKVRRCTLINVSDVLPTEIALEGASREDQRKQDSVGGQRQTAEPGHALPPATEFDESRNLVAFYGRWVGVWDNNPIATTSLTIDFLDAQGNFQQQTFVNPNSPFGSLIDVGFIPSLLGITVAANTFDASMEGTLTPFFWG